MTERTSGRGNRKGEEERGWKANRNGMEAKERIQGVRRGKEREKGENIQDVVTVRGRI